MNGKKSVTGGAAARYRQTGKSEKTVILNAFTGITGYHRRYAIVVLVKAAKACLTEVRGRVAVRRAERGKRAKCLYTKYCGGSVRAMPLRVRSRFNHRCGKLLAPFTRISIDVIAAHKLFKTSGGVKAKLKKTSPATIDRILKDTKEKLKIRGTGGTKSGNRFKTPVPMPARFECAGKPPGFFQTGLVRHDGGNPSGEFCYTLTIND